MTTDYQNILWGAIAAGLALLLLAPTVVRWAL